MDFAGFLGCIFRRPTESHRPTGTSVSENARKDDDKVRVINGEAPLSGSGSTSKDRPFGEREREVEPFSCG